MHHMTAILESVDWDEEKQKELVEYVQHSVNNDSTDFLNVIEIKYGILAKNVIKNIIKSQSYFMTLHNVGDINGH